MIFTYLNTHNVSNESLRIGVTNSFTKNPSPNERYRNNLPQSQSPQRQIAQKLQADAIKEQSRYKDIMKSIGNTEQFIKAKQAIASQDQQFDRMHRRGNRVTKHGTHR